MCTKRKTRSQEIYSINIVWLLAAHTNKQYIIGKALAFWKTTLGLIRTFASLRGVHLGRDLWIEVNSRLRIYPDNGPGFVLCCLYNTGVGEVLEACVCVVSIWPVYVYSCQGQCAEMTRIRSNTQDFITSRPL